MPKKGRWMRYNWYAAIDPGIGRRGPEELRVMRQAGSCRRAV
jgi:hypothetical protein